MARSRKATMDLSDDDSASRQLLAESQTSPQSLKITAERSASLLNAARATRRADSTMAQGKQAAGKLKRPTFHSANLAKVAELPAGRRKNVYELSLSPEKRSTSASRTSREEVKVRGDAKKAKGKTRASEKPAEVPRRTRARSRVVEDAEREQRAVQPSENQDVVEDSPRRKSHRLAGEVPDISTVDWDKRPEQSRRTTPPKRKADDHETEAERPSKSPKHTADDGPARNSESPGRGASTSLDNGSDVSADEAPAPKRRVHPRVIVRKKRRAPAEPPAPMPTIEEEDPATAGHQEQDEDMNSDDWQPPDDEEDDDLEHADQDSDDSIEDTGDGLSDLETALEFLNLPQREGSPKTEHSKKIARACNQACKLLRSPDITLDDVEIISKTLGKKLQLAHQQKDSEARLAFKEDAYAYLFPSLARSLEATFDWSKQQSSTSDPPLPILRLLLPQISQILLFESVLRTWKLPTPARPKGTTPIRTVRHHLIAPLRLAHRHLTHTLQALETSERTRKSRQEFAAQQNHYIEEEKRRAAAQEQLNARRKHWWHLHVQRLLAEPSASPRRRLHLQCPPWSDIEERDANDIPFTRESVFVERSTPFLHHTSPLLSDKWSDRQQEALLEGLERFAGRAVYERIFWTYCGRGGVLREFSVSEITGMAVYCKGKIGEVCRGRGWEVPAWVRGIPVVP